MRPRRVRGGRAGGFSLVELLVAASLVAVLAGALVTALLSGVRAWERAEGFDAARLEAVVAIETVARDFRNRVAVPQAVPFRGTAQGCAFATLAEVEGDGTATLVRVSYRFEPGRGAVAREVARLPARDPGPRDGFGEGLSTFSFSYLARPAPASNAAPDEPEAPGGWTWRETVAEPEDEVGGLRLRAAGGRSLEPFELSVTVLRP